MKKKKKFDAVQMMRDIREQLSEKYWKHPDILKKEMQAIREKYNLKITTSETKKVQVHVEAALPTVRLQYVGRRNTVSHYFFN